MSNLKDDQNKKVIKIRPLADFVTEEQTHMQKDIDEDVSTHLQVEQVKQDLAQLRQQKETMLKNLYDEINHEKESWEQVKIEEMARVKKEGYETGLAEGKHEGLTQYQDLIREANTLVEQAKDEYYDQIKESESTIAHLSIKIANKVLNDTLSNDPEALMSIVKKAIEDLQESETFSIYLHPVNYEALLKRKNELYELVDDTAIISLYVDDELQENSCLIEHDSGRIDASVDTQLKEIKRVFTQLMETDL